MLESRQEQISLKLEELHERQVESLEHRELLVREMEIASQLTRRDQEEQEAAREAFKLNLEEQVGVDSFSTSSRSFFTLI